MPVQFAPHLISLIRFAQVAAETLAGALLPRLGLGRFGFTVFLPSGTYKVIAAELTLIESLVRRCLFLIAAMRGTLPVRAAQQNPSPQRRPSVNAPQARRPPPAPRFRLLEPPGPLPKLRRQSLPVRAASHAGKTTPQNGPRPAGEGLVPAASLVRRLQALETVFLDPEANILRMRALISAAPQAILSRHVVKQTPPPGIEPVNHGLLVQIQDLADMALSQMLYDTG